MSRYKVRNWPEYSKSLENRGNLFLWMDKDIAKKWEAPATKGQVGAPRQYSDDAILCLMMIKVIFHHPYRQLVGFFGSLIQVMGITLSIPHFTTIAERARYLGENLKKLSKKHPTDLVFDSSGFKVFGEGEWKVRQHGKDRRRRWKKFHIGLCPATQEIVLTEITELEGSDCSSMVELMKRAPRSVKRVIGDGAYDKKKCYQAVADVGATLLTPPRRGAVHDLDGVEHLKNRNESVSEIEGLGGDNAARKIWKILKGYHIRSLVETAFSRLKRIFGDRLFSRSRAAQAVELNLKAYILNQMTRLGMPKGVMV